MSSPCRISARPRHAVCCGAAMLLAGRPCTDGESRPLAQGSRWQGVLTGARAYFLHTDKAQAACTQLIPCGLCATQQFGARWAQGRSGIQGAVAGAAHTSKRTVSLALVGLLLQTSITAVVTSHTTAVAAPLALLCWSLIAPASASAASRPAPLLACCCCPGDSQPDCAATGSKAAAEAATAASACAAAAVDIPRCARQFAKAPSDGMPCWQHLHTVALGVLALRRPRSCCCCCTCRAEAAARLVPCCFWMLLLSCWV